MAISRSRVADLAIISHDAEHRSNRDAPFDGDRAERVDSHAAALVGLRVLCLQATVDLFGCRVGLLDRGALPQAPEDLHPGGAALDSPIALSHQSLVLHHGDPEIE
jgi:hypothetical protein